MRCHAHAEAEAIGVCRICGRGLCAACADGSPEDHFPMLSCPDRCRAVAELQQEAVLQESSMVKDRGRTAVVLAVLATPVGLGMIYLGCASRRPPEEVLTLLGGGIVFSFVGLFPLIMTLRHDREKRKG